MIPDGVDERRSLFVFGSLERAGAQLRSLEVCEALHRRDGMGFTFCSIGLGPVEIRQDVLRAGGSVTEVSIRSPWFPFRFVRLLRDERFHVVNTEPQLLSGFIVWLAALCRVPTRIVTIHNSIGDPGQSARSRIVRAVLANHTFGWVMRSLIARHATHVVAVSRSALDSVFPGRWRSASRCSVIYNGTDHEPFHEGGDPRSVREEFGWPAESRVIINVARFTVQKNHAAIVHTMREVLERDPTVRLLLVGSGVLRQEIDRMIGDLGISASCVVTGDRTDVPRLLLGADVFFFPSSWEGLPGAPLEALAAGLPVVTSDIPSMREIASCFPADVAVAAPDDIRGHAANLAAALDRRSDEARRERQARFVASPFTLGTAVARYRELYRTGSEAHELAS